MTFTLHFLGLPHNRTESKFSSCAFAQKVVKAIPMMRSQGCRVVHYGVGSMNPGADEHHEVMTAEVQSDLLGYDPGKDPQKFSGDDAHVDHPVYKLFNAKLSRLLKKNVAPGDFVCLPFGHGHWAGTRDHAGVNIETGIGYPVCCEPFRVYESQSWRSWHEGAEKTGGSDYQWVIPNYFDVSEWDLGVGERKYLIFFGRMIESKGLSIVREIARSRPDLDVLLCGQGDASPWLSADIPNLRHIGVSIGRDRSTVLGGAIAMLTPTRYIEPFGGVTVEANLTGTPALTADFGVFPETIQSGVNGYRCHTLGDYLAAVEWAEGLSGEHRASIRDVAVSRYSLEVVGPQYMAVFMQLADLRGRGWYSLRSSIGPITKAPELSHATV